MAFFEHLLRASAAVTLSALASLPASAEPKAEAPPLTPRGDYGFYAFAQKDGHPVCTERWRFQDDGTLIVYSGQEIVTEQFRSEIYSNDNGALYLFLTKPISTNGLPDCLGHVAAKRGGEERLLVYQGRNDGIVLCWAPAQDAPPPAKGDRMILNAFGRLDPIHDGDKPPPAP